MYKVMSYYTLWPLKEENYFVYKQHGRHAQTTPDDYQKQHLQPILLVFLINWMHVPILPHACACLHAYIKEKRLKSCTPKDTYILFAGSFTNSLFWKKHNRDCAVVEKKTPEACL